MPMPSAILPAVSRAPPPASAACGAAGAGLATPTSVASVAASTPSATVFVVDPAMSTTSPAASAAMPPASVPSEAYWAAKLASLVEFDWSVRLLISLVYCCAQVLGVLTVTWVWLGVVATMPVKLGFCDSVVFGLVAQAGSDVVV